MVFEAFRTEGLAEEQTSSAIEFVVLLEAKQTFIRVIAHLRDNTILGGAPPTFLIRAGVGGPTAVDLGAGKVGIVGSGGAKVAIATCERTAEDADTYLVTVNHSAPSGPWQVQVRNNDPERLAFTGFISHVERETLQPWLDIEGELRLGGLSRTQGGIVMRNLGTAPLVLGEKPGDRLGPEASPASVFQIPQGPITPHHTDKLVADCPALAEVASATEKKFAHTFRSNDLDPAHGKISFKIVPPVLPSTRCRKNDGCREFVPRAAPDEDSCETCLHDIGFHGLPSPPGPHF
jgi:hypothetical protein